MNLHFLGTGAGIPSKFRNMQSFVFEFMQELGECWMFDCGEGTQHQMLRTNLKPTKITKIFISHLHADHVLGLVGFLASRGFLLSKEKKSVIIYGPSGIEQFVKTNLQLTNTFLMYNIEFVEFTDKACILDDKRVKVFTYPLRHTLQSYGFKIVFSDEKGSLQVDKLTKLGIMPGPFYKTIKNCDSFEFDGKIYQSSEFLSEEKKGKVISIIPDTMYFDELRQFVIGSDVLVSECTYLSEEDEQLALKHKHMSVVGVKKLVANLQLKKIFLTHISARYDISYEKVAKEYLEENCDIILAKDLMNYNID